MRTASTNFTAIRDEWRLFRRSLGRNVKVQLTSVVDEFKGNPWDLVLLIAASLFLATLIWLPFLTQ